MKQLLGRFGVGLALLLASLTNQGLAANQVKGTAQGTTWQACPRQHRPWPSTTMGLST